MNRDVFLYLCEKLPTILDAICLARTKKQWWGWFSDMIEKTVDPLLHPSMQVAMSPAHKAMILAEVRGEILGPPMFSDGVLHRGVYNRITAVGRPLRPDQRLKSIVVPKVGVEAMREAHAAQAREILCERKYKAWFSSACAGRFRKRVILPELQPVILGSSDRALQFFRILCIGKSVHQDYQHLPNVRAAVRRALKSVLEPEIRRIYSISLDNAPELLEVFNGFFDRYWDMTVYTPDESYEPIDMQEFWTGMTARIQQLSQRRFERYVAALRNRYSWAEITLELLAGLRDAQKLSTNFQDEVLPSKLLSVELKLRFYRNDNPLLELDDDRLPTFDTFDTHVYNAIRRHLSWDAIFRLACDASKRHNHETIARAYRKLDLDNVLVVLPWERVFQWYCGVMMVDYPYGNKMEFMFDVLWSIWDLQRRQLPKELHPPKRRKTQK